MNDLKFALRQVLKNPGFTLVAALSLGLGIGINTTIFSALDALVLRPLPFKDADQIVRFEQPGLFSLAEYEELRSQTRSLSGLIAVSRHMAVLKTVDGVEAVLDNVVSRNYFTVLGIKPAAGALFSEGEPGHAADRGMVISYGLWQRRFGGDPKIVGQTVPMVEGPVTVVGVAAKGFTGADRVPPCEVWYPADFATWQADRNARDFALLGRLRPGFTVQQVQVEAATLVPRVVTELPKSGPGAEVFVHSEAGFLRDRGKAGALIVLAVVGLVLVVACANVSSLLLARYEERRREMAVRVALGGGRLRLLRQLLLEGFVLAMIGAGAAMLLTVWAIRLVPALLPPIGFAYAPELAADGRVFGFALGLAVVATLVFALLPAWRATRADVGVLLKGEEAPVRFGRLRAFNARNLLVIGQLAVALGFLATAALLVRGFLNVYKTELGFEPDRVLIVPFLGVMSGGEGLETQRMSPEARARYLSRLEQDRISFPRRLQEDLRGLPGVETVSFGRPPLSMTEDGMAAKVLVPGDDPKPKDILCNLVDPGYFKTLGIRLLSGRDFEDRDDRAGPRVVIISQAMAKRFWPGQNPVGQRLRIGFGDLIPREIVGVAGDVPIHSGSGPGDPPEPLVYFPRHQEDRGSLWLLVRTAGDPAEMMGVVRREIRQVGKGLVTLELPPMDLLRFSTLPQWIGMWLGGTLGALAFLLAVGGLYGVVAYAVSRRTREIGIRLALGARRRTVLWLLLRDGLVLALAGVAIGLPLTLIGGLALRALLFGVSPADPLALGGATLLVISVALLASYLPARRAMRVNPMEALRYE